MKGKEITFKELWEIGNLPENDLRHSLVEGSRGTFLSRTYNVLRSAHRGYLRNNLDPSSEGNYLVDFLERHGDDSVSPIILDEGDPHCMGAGIQFEDTGKIRRRFEDFLRKSSISDLYAAMAAVNQI